MAATSKKSRQKSLVLFFAFVIPIKALTKNDSIDQKKEAFF